MLHKTMRISVLEHYIKKIYAKKRLSLFIHFITKKS